MLGARIAKNLDATRHEIREILEQIELQQNSASLHTIMPLLSKMLSEAQDVSVGQRILRSLRFDVMHHRRIGIKKTFETTYEWIFLSDDELETTKGVRTGFKTWLRSGNGVYWISGKAGSGKSTLMKFLASHLSTRTALEAWTDVGNKVVVAAFFFYFYGSDLERTQIGLFKALLFEVLRCCPDLASSLCAERWNAGGANKFGSEDWDLEQLSQAIDRLRSQAFLSDGVATKFCFFIDGLDEYDGDHNDIIAFIKTMSSCTNVKVVASSRPWNVFKKAFGGDENRMLTLQELTEDDIRQYTEGQLIDYCPSILEHADDFSYADIVQEVTEKAQGVFLWVYLVVKELRKSLQNGDSLFDIRRRLERIPPDLEPYFKRMFSTIEDFYREQAALIFLVCIRSRDPVYLASLAALESNDPLARKFCSDQVVSSRDVHCLQTRLVSRVNARCLDLLEVKPCEGVLRVEFLHRTLRDFLETRDMLAMITDWAGVNTDPLELLCSMDLVVFKRLDTLLGEDENTAQSDMSVSLLRRLLSHCSDVEMIQARTPNLVLDDLRKHVSQNVLDTMYRGYRLSIFLHAKPPVPSIEKDDPFLVLCARYELCLYLQHCQERSGLLGLHTSSLLLMDVLENLCCVSKKDSEQFSSRTQNTIELLMANGIDPNIQMMCYSSLWVWFLDLLGKRLGTRRRNDKARTICLSLAESMVRKGATFDTGKHEWAVLSSCFGAEEATRIVALRPRLTIKSAFAVVKFPWRN